MAAVPVGAKLHRFAPTRELTADYESVVPANVRSGEKTRVLRQFLKQRDDESVTGEMTNCNNLYATTQDVCFSVGRHGGGASNPSAFC